ncbi:MAG: RtcB family protein, partial [Sphingobacteriales bacterium]
MGKLTITGKELRAIGYPEGPVISMAMNIVHRKFKHGIREEVMKVLKEILEKPEAFEDDAIWASIAGKLVPPEEEHDAELS